MVTNLSAPLFLSFFLLLLGSSFQQLNFELYRQKLLAGKEKESSQIFNVELSVPPASPQATKGIEIYLSSFRNGVWGLTSVFDLAEKGEKEFTVLIEIGLKSSWI